MALNPGGPSTTAYCDHGTGASVAGSYTWIMLAYWSTGGSGNRDILMQRGWDGSGQNSLYIRYSVADRMKVDISYSATWISLTAAAGSALTTGWWWLAAAHDSVAKRGYLYQAPFGSPLAEVAYSTRQDGVGTYGPSSATFTVGGAAGASWSVHDPIELAAAFSSALSLDELIKFQGHQHDVSGGNIEMLVPYGRDRSSATATQQDMSGQGNHGTPTNAGWAFADAPAIGPRFGRKRRQQLWVPSSSVATGRIMSSMTHHGGLAGPGGIAGKGGGLAA